MSDRGEIRSQGCGVFGINEAEAQEQAGGYFRRGVFGIHEAEAKEQAGGHEK